MIVTTTDFIPGYEIVEVIGICRGSSVRARNFGRDIIASLRNLIGGEIKEYTVLQKESRDQAMERMIAEATELNADAILNVRLTTAMIMQATAEILAYGTAVKIRKKE
ncbi:MAG: heavy metal-binding domain-containing protein [Bacteroidetes bacterium]|nr:heavy metal-binding domain-containing protein [Bacteroidota bacterium]